MMACSGLLVGASLLAACGSTTAEQPKAAPTVVVTATATVTTDPTPVAPASSKPAPAKAAAPKPKKKAPKPAAETYTMPSEIGNVLQSSQEDIEGILGVPVWPLLQSHDVKEGWRFQVLDSDWKVCDQDPAPGATFDETTVIDFGVVKLDERCP